MATLGFDKDDVLSPFFGPLLEQHNRDYGTEFDETQFGGTPRLNDWFGRDSQHWTDYCNYFHREGLSSQIEPDPEMQRLVGDFKEEGHKLHVVTAQPSWNEPNLIEWLDRHYSGVFSSLVMCTSVSVTGSTWHMDKGEVAKDLGLDAFIDDQTRNVLTVVKAGVIGVVQGDNSWSTDGRQHVLHGATVAETEDHLRTEVPDLAA